MSPLRAPRYRGNELRHVLIVNSAPIRLMIAATSANLGHILVPICFVSRFSYDCSSTRRERGGVNWDVWAGSIRKAITINTRSHFRI